MAWSICHGMPLVSKPTYLNTTRAQLESLIDPVSMDKYGYERLS